MSESSSPTGFTDRPYKEVGGPGAGTLAWQAGYTKPLRWRITVKDAFEDETLVTYDSWNRTNPGVSLTDISVTEGMNLAGDFVIGINDSRDRIIDEDKLDTGCIAIIECGKTPDSMVRKGYGIIYVLEGERVSDRYRQYFLEGLGWGSVTQYTHINMQKIAPPVKVTSKNPLLHLEKLYNLEDTRFLAWQIFKDIFDDPLVMPFGGPTLQQRARLTLYGISKLVADFLPTSNYPMIVASEVIKNVANITGAFAQISEDGEVLFMHPNSMTSGHIIRADFKEDDPGLSDWTSYSDGRWSYSNSILPSTNFANRLIARAEKIDNMTGSVSAVQATSLYNKDIGQRIPPTTVMSNLSFVLSKSNAGTDENDPEHAYLYGAIVEDNDFQPTGARIARFRIPIRDINIGTPAPVPKIKYVFEPGVSGFNPSRFHWWFLFERGSGDEQAGDFENTIYVWNNGDNETMGQYSAIRPLKFGRSNGDPLSNVGWVVQGRGPTYSYGFATKKTILCEMSDPSSIRKWTPDRPIERFIPTLHGASIRHMMVYMSHILSTSSKQRRTFGFNDVTIPNKLFKAGSFVHIRDENTKPLQAKRGAYAQLQEVTYAASASSNDPRGSHFCKVSPRQFVRPHNSVISKLKH